MHSGSFLIRAFAGAAFLACAGLLVISGTAAAADANPFSVLLGSWGGSGEYRLKDGTSQRLKCNAYYTGGGSQLGMAIRCSSDTSKIEIRSKLNNSGGHLSGNWEERTYNAAGTATGQASGDKLSIAISGSVSGNMLVSFSRTRQTVSISTQGSALSSVNITLSRS